MYTIVRREQFSESTFLWDVHAPDVARSAEPGQFVMLRLREGGERVPLTIADFDREWGTITMVVQAVGKTTKEMLLDYKEGDTFSDFVGPLGAESHIKNLGHVVLVGGGLGVAPIFPQLRAFKEAGCRTTAIIGFRSKELVFWEEKFGKWCDELIVCTDDGSYGRPGFVTNALADVLAKDRPALVVAIGPLPMMRACTETTRPRAVPTIVSLNAIMLDGTGMCGSCRVRVDGEVRFACVDGPDFDAHMIDFSELVGRQVRFAKEEKTAAEDYSKICGLEKTLFTDEKRNYKKFKELAPHATLMPERSADERSKNFAEVNLGYRMADALQEAERCIQCLKPSCVEGCPVSIDIPRFIRHLIVRDLPGALAVIQETNLFPSICGRVCPQESQCEAQCILVKKMEPVAIGRLERFVGDYGVVAGNSLTERDAKSPDSLVPREKIGRVAVVGSGPAGLACAGDLAKKGAEVTVFEALHVIGGVLRYGIPAFRLPREIIDREVAAVAALGVTFQLNKVIGKTFTIADLLGKMGYDAVFVGTGAGAPSFLGIPGEFAGQVYSANEFLTRVNLMGGDRFPYEDTPVTFGKRVVVIGAGNTAMDCLRVARRLGALEVRCVYRRTEAEAPARIEEIRHAKEEGITFHWLRGPVKIRTGEAGSVEALVCQVMELGEPDTSGRRRPMPVEGVMETFECDTVIYALGTKANPIIARSTPGLDTRGDGYINVDVKTQAANLPGVFAGGDIVTGAATVILALGAGRRAARAIESYLKTREWPPRAEEPMPAEARLEPQTPSCPRCGVPLAEGEEETICCADRRLIWTCTSCCKVSEGFAFPFGLCPLCGGGLHMEHDTVVAGNEAVEAIRSAYEIELGGVAFYERGARDARNPEVAKLFGRLAAMEREHMTTLARRYHVEEQEAPVPYVSPARIAIYTGHDGRLESPADLLRLAVHLENRARLFFLETGRRFDPSSLEWRLYRELEAEEREHAEMLATALLNVEAMRPVLV